MASKNGHELDQERREQMRLLLAQQDEKAVAHRFGEQALQSDEYLQAQEDLEKRANAQRQRREELYEAGERQQAAQLGIEDSDQAVGFDEAGNGLDEAGADEITQEQADLLERQEAEREEAERIQQEADRQAELDRQVEQEQEVEREQADREESREPAERGRGDEQASEQSVARDGQDRAPERELSTAQRLTAQHRASQAAQSRGDDIAEDQGRDAGDEVEHEPSTAERLNAQYRTQQEQERSRAAAMSL